MAVEDYSNVQRTEVVDKIILSPFGMIVKHRKEIFYAKIGTKFR